MQKIHFSAMSNSAWSDLNSQGYFLKVYDLCRNSECNCEKQYTFTPRQFQLEGAGFENATKKFSKEVKKHRTRFLINNQHFSTCHRYGCWS